MWYKKLIKGKSAFFEDDNSKIIQTIKKLSIERFPVKKRFLMVLTDQNDVCWHWNWDTFHSTKDS